VRRALWNIALGMFIGLLCAVSVAAVALGLRLRQGPIELPWLDRRFEEALSGLAPGLRAEIEHAELAWLHHLPELRVVGVKIERQDRKLLMSVPALGVRPSLRAFVHARLAVERLNVTGVRIALVRDAGGRLLLGSGGEHAEQAPVDLSALLAGQGDGGDTATYLKRIHVRDTDVRLEERASGGTWRVEGAEIDVRRAGKVFRVDGNARLRMDNSNASVVRALALPLSGQARIDLADDGGVRDIAFDFQSPEGAVTPHEAPAVAVTGLVVKGALSMASRKVELANVRGTIGTAELQSSAKLSIDDLRQGLELSGELRSLAVDDLQHFWPPDAAPAAREWIVTNIHDGTVPRCHFAIRLPEGDAAARRVAADAVDLKFDFDGLTVDYLRELTPVKNVRGSATLDAERFEAHVTDGAIASLRLQDGHVGIRFRGAPPRVVVAADVTGPAEEVFSVLEHPPLEIPQAIGIAAHQLSGMSRSQLQIEVPIKHGVQSSDVIVRAHGDLREATVTDVLAGIGIDGGNLAVTVDGRKVDVAGEAEVTGLPAPSGRARIAVAFAPAPSGTGDSLKVTVEGKDVRAAADASLDGRTLKTLDVADLRFAGNELHGRIARQSAGYRASIDASSIDIEPLLRGGNAGTQTIQSIAVPYDVELRAARVRVSDDVTIAAVRGTAHLEGGRFATAHATGTVPSSGALRIDLAEQGPVKHLEIASGEAGRLLKALGIFKDAEAGTLLLTATVDDRDRARVEGELGVNDLRVIRAPILAKVLSVGSFTGIADLLQGEGLTFSRTRVPFTWSAGKVKVHDARAVGAIGITADGEIDRPSHRVAFHGSIFPAYTLNSALGKIPWIGDLLVGGEGLGLFGIEYWVAGDRNNPDVRVNGLSALAPGALRKMFVEPFQHAPKPPEASTR
jgi:Protein of unknown function/AsmA-like C-terminal region